MFIKRNNNNIVKYKVILRVSNSVKAKYIINKIEGNDYIVINLRDITPRKI